MYSLRGFYDLCVNATLFEPEKYKNTITTLYIHGYRTVAINYVLEEESTQGTTQEGGKKRKTEQQTAKAEILPKIFRFNNNQQQNDIRIFHRITIQLHTKDFFAKISKLPDFKQFDIIAVMPLSVEALNFMCGDCPADILSMISNQKYWKYSLIRKQYKQLVARGCFMELPYAGLLSDDTNRKLLISLAHDFHITGKSRNVLVSSGAHTTQDLRNAYDVVNMGLILGLGQAQSKCALLQHGRTVCLKAQSRRNGKIAIISQNSNEESHCTNNDASQLGNQTKKLKI